MFFQFLLKNLYVTLRWLTLHRVRVSRSKHSTETDSMLTNTVQSQKMTFSESPKLTNTRQSQIPCWLTQREFGVAADKQGAESYSALINTAWSFAVILFVFKVSPFLLREFIRAGPMFLNCFLHSVCQCSSILPLGSSFPCSLENIFCVFQGSHSSAHKFKTWLRVPVSRPSPNFFFAFVKLDCIPRK